MDKCLLLDGDVLAYKFAFAAEVPIEWEDGLWTYHADARESIAVLDEFIDDLKDRFKTVRYRTFLSSGVSFRKKVWEGYKANRSGKRKPLLLSRLREHLMRYHNVEMQLHIEADDLMGIAGNRKKDMVICTIDKDLQTIPGSHYNWDTQVSFKVTPKQAWMKFYEQTLSGDAVDGYPGCPGIGPKRGGKIVQEAYEGSRKPHQSVWQAIVGAYEKAGKTEEDALAQARCAYILRTQKDLKDGEARLWTPR